MAFKGLKGVKMAQHVFAQLNESDLRKVAQLWSQDLWLWIDSNQSWQWSSPLWEGFNPQTWDDLLMALELESAAHLQAFLKEPSKSIVLKFAQTKPLKIFELSACSLGEKGQIYRFNATLSPESLQQCMAGQTYDPLTHLYNRAFFETELKRLDLGRSFPISVICLDLGSLRPVNTALGNEAGDQYLIQASELLRQTFRREDIVCRIDGGGFAALLPNTGAEGAHVALARLRDKVVESNEHQNEYEIQFSLGIASVAAPGRLKEAFLEADRRMQAEKNARKFKRGF